MLILTIPQN